MLYNYLKIAVRNLLRHKVFSAINLFGLSVGLASCLLIVLYILQELSYDKHHAKADRIYRVTRDFINPDGSVGLQLGNVAPPFGPLLKSYFSDLEEVGRMLKFSSVVSVNPEKAFNEENIYFAEPSLLNIFTIPVLRGNPANVLNEPFAMLVSDKVVQKYFGDKDPVGQVLKIDGQIQVKVTGVFKVFPANSHLHPDFLVSFSTLEDDNIYGRNNLQSNWGSNNFTTYLLFPQNYPVDKVEAQFPTFLDKHIQVDSKAGKKPSSWTRLNLQKLADIHLYSHLDTELEENGNITNV
ncbi:ABC transporter permease [Adhaeribacter aquaticus]|uniref:ABC transporter permease n=1 Tax=Adhaeribacter aquaticus TaxID=299567 RepID=UPI00041D7BBF|nr:ABC transporter permease [Adhaeribacter aquaticus]